MRSRLHTMSDSPTPIWVKAWFAFAAAVAMSLIGVTVWAVFAVVDWATR